MRTDFIRNWFSTRTADCDSKAGAGKFVGNVTQKTLTGIPLLRMMTLVMIVNDFVFFSIKN